MKILFDEIDITFEENEFNGKKRMYINIQDIYRKEMCLKF